MERTIVGFDRDGEGAWVAELSCLHAQHIRHQPPFRTAPWVLDDDARAARVGSNIDCPLCDRAELPQGLQVVRSSPTWDTETVPAALRRTHKLGDGVWGQLRVLEGRIRFEARTRTPLVILVEEGRTQAIPPGVEHHVEPQGPARFLVEFLRRPGDDPLP